MHTTPENTNIGPQGLSVDDLLKRQSVRATFKLSPEIIDLLGMIAGQLGVQQKSLLDQLVEDTVLLSRLAAEAEKSTQKRDGRRQKTFVLSRSSLNAINTIARRKKIPRDVLVEISIRQLLPIIETELEKHNKRKRIYKDMQEHMRQGIKLREKVRDLLGEDDTVFGMVDQQVSVAEKNLAALCSIIEKGAPMEEW